MLENGGHLKMGSNNWIIGKKLKSFRNNNKLTLNEVSQQLNCSAAFLSMLENGRSGISLSNLQKLLSIYGKTMADLVDDANQSNRVVSLENAHTLGYGMDGVEALLLVREPHHKLIEPIFFRVLPGATVGPMCHEGEEFGYVLEGCFDVTLTDTLTGDTEVHHLVAGDTIYYPSKMPHVWYNPSDRPSIFLGAVTPSSF